MYRCLSKALIIVLMLLSPVSFSTDKIPNFAPDCEARLLYVEKSVLAAVDTCLQTTVRFRDQPGSIREHFAFPLAFSHIDSILTVYSSRAPPIALSPKRSFPS